jgi:hypothetical protein
VIVQCLAASEKSPKIQAILPSKMCKLGGLLAKPLFATASA